MEFMLMPLRRYADFSGRSRRMEFWMFQLFLMLTNLVFIMIFMAGFPWDEMSAMQTTVDVPVAQDPQSAEEVLAMFGPLFWVGLALVMLWGLFVFIPSMAVTVRRLHDRDMSGWWYGGALIASFVPLVNVLALPVFLFVFVMMFLPGTPGPNRYGPDPKDPAQANVFR